MFVFIVLVIQIYLNIFLKLYSFRYVKCYYYHLQNILYYIILFKLKSHKLILIIDILYNNSNCYQIYIYYIIGYVILLCINNQ